MKIDFEGIEKLINPVYYQLYKDKSRYEIVYGSAGSGKSVSIAQKIILKVITQIGQNWIICRKVGNTIKDSCFAELLKVINQWNLRDLFKINNSDHIIECINGNVILSKGLDDPEKVKSVTVKTGNIVGIWIEEATETDQDDLNTLDERLRGTSKIPFQMILSFNPVSIDHWIKAYFIDIPRDNVFVLKTTYKDNLFIDDAYKKLLESYKDLNPLRYQVYALGEWGQMGDKVFSNIVYEPCPYKLEDFDIVRAGLDFGYNHYQAIELVGHKDGELWSFGELYLREKLNTDIIEINNKLGILPKDLRCYADSAEPKGIIEWQRAGYTMEAVKKGADSVYAGFQYLKSKRWHIDPVKCPGLANEVKNAVYVKDKKTGKLKDDEVFSFHDDAISSIRYACEPDMLRQNVYVTFV